MWAPDRAWYDDIRALPRRPDEFWPRAAHSSEERLNSIIRLIVYVTLGVSLYRGDVRYVTFGALAVTLVSLAHSSVFRSTRRHRRAADESFEEEAHPAMGGIRKRSSQKPSALACTASTPRNPFANMLLTDLADDPGRPPACKYDDHKHLIHQNFNKGLVRNAYDVYDKENSQRQWMTMPVTTSAPDTIAFAQFCYGNAGRKTCKEDPSRCTGAFP